MSRRAKSCGAIIVLLTQKMIAQQERGYTETLERTMIPAINNPIAVKKRT